MKLIFEEVQLNLNQVKQYKTQVQTRRRKLLGSGFEQICIASDKDLD